MNGVYLYKKIEAWNPDRFREYFSSHHPEDYLLIDVRQLPDYGNEHLPGALWIPAENLPRQAQTLDFEKTTLIYCDQGALSRAAAEVLVKAGCKDVHFLEGGLHAWQHGTSTGLPQQVCASFFANQDAKAQSVIAWYMEEATRCFYEEMAEMLKESEVAALFAELAVAESCHKATLKALWEALAGRPATDDFPPPDSHAKNLMEGGMQLEDVLSWAARSSTEQILDFAMALELNAYDHYLYLQRNADNPDSQRLFEVIADEERHHLKSLGQSLGQLQGKANNSQVPGWQKPLLRS